MQHSDLRVKDVLEQVLYECGFRGEQVDEIVEMVMVRLPW